MWTQPFRVEITSAVHRGRKHLEVDLVNLWPNRMIGNVLLPPEKRYRQTNIPIYHDREQPQKLLPSGLLGPVIVLVGS